MVVDLAILAAKHTLQLRLKEARAVRQWSQRELGEAAGIATGTIGDFEKGRAVPSLASLVRLALALDTDVGELVGPTYRPT